MDMKNFSLYVKAQIFAQAVASTTRSAATWLETSVDNTMHHLSASRFSRALSLKDAAALSRSLDSLGTPKPKEGKRRPLFDGAKSFLHVALCDEPDGVHQLGLAIEALRSAKGLELASCAARDAFWSARTFADGRTPFEWIHEDISHKSMDDRQAKGADLLIQLSSLIPLISNARARFAL
jgi:hypothetical protein